MNTRDESNEWSTEEQRLRSALNTAAEQVTPGPDGLARIRRRTAAAAPWWRRPVVLGLAGATAVAAAFIFGSVVVLGGDDGDTVVTADSPSPALSGSATPTESGVAEPDGTDTTAPGGEPTSQAPTQTITVPTYYVVDLDGELRLAREFRSVETSEDPVTTAVAQLAEPALDPDYTTLWPAGLEVRSAEVTDGTIEVDLGTENLPEVSSSEAVRVAMQQLVYTATAAASMHDAGDASSVRVRVDGQPAAQLFGDSSLAEPVGREDPLEIRQLVQIDDPAEGATVTSPVTVRGSGAAFEATLAWEVRRDGEVVESDFTTAEECCTMSPFEFEVELEPGSYEVVVSEVDVSGGEGRPPMSDSKTFTVE